MATTLAVVAFLGTGCRKVETISGFPDEFVGVGLELRIDGGFPVVVRPLAGGPAAKAGVAKGDRVLSVDGQQTEGMSLGDVVMRLRGRAGSQVTLTVDRAGEQVHVVVRRTPMTKAGASDYQVLTGRGS